MSTYTHEQTKQKAAELWATFDEDDRALCRSGFIFPCAVLDVVKQGYDQDALLSALTSITP